MFEGMNADIDVENKADGRWRNSDVDMESTRLALCNPSPTSR